jgi:trimeric autotransporter adhesin
MVKATNRRLALSLFLAIALALVLATLAKPAGAATTFTVNKTGDASDGNISDSTCDTSKKNGKQCTLRAAIEEANDTPGADIIEFDIGSGSSLRTISPASALPDITDPVTIDGYTQRGARENTLEEGTDAVLKVELDGTNAVGASGFRIDAADSTIKGLVINRFNSSGISVNGAGNDGNRIEGNFIGTNAAGTADRGNSTGVSIGDQSADNTIGGTQPAQRNLISGNDGSGIGVAGTPTRNEVSGNLIGTTADGSGDLGNGSTGVVLFGPSNAVGGTEPGAGNTISGNGSDGVLVNGSSATGNSVLSNRIFANDGLGIDLNNDDVTANDTDDPDTGENNLQNFPVINSATRSSTTGVTTITGTLNSNPNEDFLIQCFLTESQPDASGHGEGAALLDTTSRSTGPAGNATFQCNSPEPGNGQRVTATATNIATGDTSEFSENEEVIGAIPPP